MIPAAKGTVKSLLPRCFCIQKLRSRVDRTVLLTFDDGPHPQTTPAVLERLQSHGARALFFVVGNRLQRAPQVLRQIVGEGHLLGNHTYTHPLYHRMRYREYLSDLSRCQDEILQLTGCRPRFCRPPLGHLSLASLLAPRRLGLVTVTWSRSSEDWRFRSNEEAIARADELAAEIGAGDIVLFHDESPYVLLALDQLLPVLTSRGLSFAPDLDDLG